jgi:hypothetical protein
MAVYWVVHSCAIFTVKVYGFRVSLFALLHCVVLTRFTLPTLQRFPPAQHNQVHRRPKAQVDTAQAWVIGARSETSRRSQQYLDNMIS